MCSTVWHNVERQNANKRENSPHTPWHSLDGWEEAEEAKQSYIVPLHLILSTHFNIAILIQAKVNVATLKLPSKKNIMTEVSVSYGSYVTPSYGIHVGSTSIKTSRTAAFKSLSFTFRLGNIASIWLLSSPA